MHFVDTSVLVAYLCPEPLHNPARKALANASQRLISPLVRVEVASALAIKTRTGELDASAARMVLAELQRQIDEGIFTLRDLSTSEFRQAYEWLATFRTSLRALDALHLASAFAFNATMLTADHGLSDAAKILRVPCKLIR